MFWPKVKRLPESVEHEGAFCVLICCNLRRSWRETRPQNLIIPAITLFRNRQLPVFHAAAPHTRPPTASNRFSPVPSASSCRNDVNETRMRGSHFSLGGTVLFVSGCLLSLLAGALAAAAARLGTAAPAGGLLAGKTNNTNKQRKK